MKKIFSKIIILCAVCMLCSCVIVTPHIHSDFTFKNNTKDDICDWYLKNDDGENFAKRKGYVSVPAHSSSTLEDVLIGTYRVFFAYDDEPEQYYYSDWIFVDDDTTYKLRTDTAVYTRSAVASESESEGVLYLEDSKGDCVKVYAAN